MAHVPKYHTAILNQCFGKRNSTQQMPFNMACNFDVNRKSFTFVWILDNFEFCVHETGCTLISPTFIVAGIERSKWSLTMYPRGKTSGNWISLFLWRESDSKGPSFIDLYYELAIQTVDGVVLVPEKVRGYAFSKHSYNGFPLFIKRDSIFAEKAKFLPHGALTIRCRMWRMNGEVSMDGQCVARTRFGVERKTFLWKILNFSNFYVGQEDKIRLKSTSDDNPLVSLTLFIRETRRSDDIIIRFISSNLRFQISTVKFALVTAQGNNVDCGQHKFLLNFFQSEEYMLPLSKDTLKDNNSFYLPNDALTLRCELAFSSGAVSQEIEGTFYAGCSNSFISNNVVPENKQIAKMKKSGSETSDLKIDINSMLQDKTLCDVKLCVGSETFSAHWFILSARSPVFRAMFQSGMKEKSLDQINIEDLKPDIVRHLLLYMYTDSLEELQWETAADLCLAADKYQILPLKDKCSSFLKSNINLSNACKLLHLSDLLQDKELKSIVQGFILKNDKSIFNSSDWKVLMKDNASVAAETMYLKCKE